MISTLTFDIADHVCPMELRLQLDIRDSACTLADEFFVGNLSCCLVAAEFLVMEFGLICLNITGVCTSQASATAEC